MIEDFSNYDIYIMPGSTDMRKQINGLSVIAEEEICNDVFSKNFFYFVTDQKHI